MYECSDRYSWFSSNPYLCIHCHQTQRLVQEIKQSDLWFWRNQMCANLFTHQKQIRWHVQHKSLYCNRAACWAVGALPSKIAPMGSCIWSITQDTGHRIQDTFFAQDTQEMPVGTSILLYWVVHPICNYMSTFKDAEVHDMLLVTWWPRKSNYICPLFCTNGELLVACINIWWLHILHQLLDIFSVADISKIYIQALWSCSCLAHALAACNDTTDPAYALGFDLH